MPRIKDLGTVCKRQKRARVTNEELVKIARSFASNKAPASYAIQNVVLKATIIADQGMLITATQHCIYQRFFPAV